MLYQPSPAQPSSASELFMNIYTVVDVVTGTQAIISQFLSQPYLINILLYRLLIIIIILNRFICGSLFGVSYLTSMHELRMNVQHLLSH